MVYEAQFLARAAAQHGSIGPDRVLAYPEPTVLTKHTLVPLTPGGDRVGRLLTGDPELQRLAVKWGFRTSDGANVRRYLTERKVAPPPDLVTIVEPPTYEALDPPVDRQHPEQGEQHDQQGRQRRQRAGGQHRDAGQVAQGREVVHAGQAHDLPPRVLVGARLPRLGAFDLLDPVPEQPPRQRPGRMPDADQAVTRRRHHLRRGPPHCHAPGQLGCSGGLLPRVAVGTP
jgi:hypothetical protein